MAGRGKNIDRKLLKLYLDGELRGEEAYEFERLILARQFESESMEGFERISSQDFEVDMARLDKRLENRISSEGAGGSQSFFRTYFARIAAAVLFLAVAGYFLFTVVIEAPRFNEERIASSEAIVSDSTMEENFQDTTMLAMEESKEEFQEPEPEATSTLEPEVDVEEDVTAEIITEVVDEDAVVADQVIAEDLSGTGFSATENTFQDTVNQVTSEIEQTLVLAEAETEDTIVTLGEEASREVSSARRFEETRSKSAAPAAISLDEPEENTYLTVSGNISARGENGPLAGVEVRTGSGARVFTDLNGNFSVPVETGEQLSFNYSGYSTPQINYTGQPDLSIQMSSIGSQSVEYVSYSYAAGTNEITSTGASPAGGISGLRTYISENRVYPNAASENGVSGAVVVVFTVSSSGTLSNFRTVKSLGYGCDEEAIRLIQNGPTWTGVAGRTAEVRMRIWFGG